jgi:hypothetical protein
MLKQARQQLRFQALLAERAHFMRYKFSRLQRAPLTMNLSGRATMREARRAWKRESTTLRAA